MTLRPCRFIDLVKVEIAHHRYYSDTRDERWEVKLKSFYFLLTQVNEGDTTHYIDLNRSEYITVGGCNCSESMALFIRYLCR